jgi:hypothetical protein
MEFAVWTETAVFSFHSGDSIRSKVFLSRRIGSFLGLLFSACKRELLKSVIQGGQRGGSREVGKHPGGGTVVRELIGWKQFSCLGR